MSEPSPQSGTDPYRFIQDNIDSVPHLEALILLWNSRPVWWTEEELASRLYVPQEQVVQIMRDLIRIRAAQETNASPPKYSYLPAEEQNQLMYEVDAAYRRDLVRISTMIHSRASSPVREFARAFRLRKEREK